MEKNTTIGEMINDEVRRKQIPIIEFAKKINCERANVYNIFKRNNIDIELLKRISKVLDHNYFDDLAKNMDLARPVELSLEEQRKLQTINNFIEAVPKAFERLHINASIVLGTKTDEEKEIPLPDYILSDFNITFTIGQTYKEKCNGYWGNKVMFIDVSPDCPANMVCYHRQDTGIQYLDIALEYMSEEEWYDTILFALREIETLYLPKTWNYLKSLKDDRARL